MRFEYPAQFEIHKSEIVVSFPDVPEAITAGADVDEAYREGADALGAALAGYVQEQRSLPKPSKPRKGNVMVAPAPLIAAKLALRLRMRELGLNNVALAARLGVSETIVRRLVDPDHESKLANVAEALAVMGQHMVIEVENNRADAA
ncbi:MAG TPA: type II toxin-antitoxin system HicB family antitoxin [Gammaproteobacteria bacterium]